MSWSVCMINADWAMDMTMQAMSYWLETSYVGNSGGYFLFRMCGGYCVDLLEFMCVVWINKLTFWPVVYIYMTFILMCTCIFVFTVPVDFATDSEAVLTMTFFKATSVVHAVYVFSRLRHHADRRSFNVVLQIVSLTDLTINLFQTLHCFWILLTSKAVWTENNNYNQFFQDECVSPKTMRQIVLGEVPGPRFAPFILSTANWLLTAQKYTIFCFQEKWDALFNVLVFCLVQTISTVAFTKLLDVPELGRYDAMHYFVSFVKISTTLFWLCDQGLCETFVDYLWAL